MGKGTICGTPGCSSGAFPSGSGLLLCGGLASSPLVQGMYAFIYRSYIAVSSILALLFPLFVFHVFVVLLSQVHDRSLLVSRITSGKLLAFRSQELRFDSVNRR